MVYTTFENGENNGYGIFLGYLWNSKHTTYKNGDNNGYNNGLYLKSRGWIMDSG